MTSSCFCLALRPSVRPNPQLLPGLDLLPPLPSLPRLPASCAEATAGVRYSSAVTRAGSRLQDGGGEGRGGSAQRSGEDHGAVSPPRECGGRRRGGEIGSRRQEGRRAGLAAGSCPSTRRGAPQIRAGARGQVPCPPPVASGSPNPPQGCRGAATPSQGPRGLGKSLRGAAIPEAPLPPAPRPGPRAPHSARLERHRAGGSRLSPRSDGNGGATAGGAGPEVGLGTVAPRSAGRAAGPGPQGEPPGRTGGPGPGLNRA